MLLAMLTGCSWNTTTPDGPKESRFNIKSLGKSDIDDVLDVHVREARQYLRELMIKLYKRNPKELKKSQYQDMDKNLARVFDEIHNWNYEELNRQKSIDAIYLTFDDAYEGDRVFAFIVGLTSMIMAAYDNKTDFYLFDSIDPQKLYNSARNMEIAVWKLGHTTNENGELYLYSNSLPGEITNLSYERLFGKLVAIQDTIAIIIAGKTNRTIKTVIQSMATAVFLPI
ncbi:MAG: hypothetical protein HW411_1323 [Gammaproteobacteria bacterium]|nr:hypothetical protein [Gammaproteobacteria bacterium]